MSKFNDDIYKIVASIPEGRVTTYGTIAALSGKPRAARIVGGIAHFGPPELPWQRVVKANGYLAEGFPGGVDGHRQALQQDGVEVSDEFRVIHFRDVFWSGLNERKQ